MNTKIIASFIAGAATGGVGMYIYLTKFKKIEYEVIEPKESIYIEEENEEGEKEWRQYGKTDKVLETKEEIPDVDLMDYYRQKEESGEETPMMDYQQFAKDAEKAFERPDPAQVPKKREVTTIITEEEFLEERDKEDLGERHMSSAVICVYSDGICVDETSGEEHVYMKDEVDDFMGYENIQKFIDNPDQDTIYIRNLAYGIDYEVYKKEIGWAEMNGFDADEDNDE